MVKMVKKQSSSTVDRRNGPKMVKMVKNRSKMVTIDKIQVKTIHFRVNRELGTFFEKPKKHNKNLAKTLGDQRKT